MRFFIVILFSVVLLQTGHGADNSAPKNWQIYFSPSGGCTEAVVAALNGAKTAILVQAYSFTSAPIAKALLDAHKRGVKVVVILDKSQRTEKYSSADFLHNGGIPTHIDAKHAISTIDQITTLASHLVEGFFFSKQSGLTLDSWTV